jgi:hypothetical protein
MYLLEKVGVLNYGNTTRQHINVSTTTTSTTALDNGGGGNDSSGTVRRDLIVT